MKAKLSLIRRFTITILGILIVVSCVYFLVYKYLYSQNSERLVEQLQESTSLSLQSQLQRRGEALGFVLSNNLFDPMYNYNVELVYQLMMPVMALDEVQVLHVVDKEGFIFHDGDKDLLLYAEPHPKQMLLLQAMQEGRHFSESTQQGVLFAIPVMALSEVVGAVYLELSAKQLSTDLQQQYQAIEEIRAKDQKQFFMLQVMLSIGLIAFSFLIMWLYIRSLSKPLYRLIHELRNNPGHNEFISIEGETRADEIGLLTRAYNEMGEKINKRTEAIKQLIDHDSLTQLPNRQKFVSHVQSLIENQQAQRIHVLFIDLDEFKAANDNFGHAIGDAMLITIANRLSQLVKFHRLFNSGEGAFHNNMVARIGGDEFLMAIVNAEEDSALLLGDIILNSLRSYLNLEGNQIVASGSVGVSCFPDFSSEAEELIAQADIAMYYAKSKGKNGCSLFSQAMKLDAEHKAQIEQELKYAMNDLSQFELWYQPKVEISTQRLVGAEALLRWKHPTRGYIFPDQFIPVAEKSDMILKIGEALIFQLAEQIGSWQKHSQIDDNFHVALNVSVRQIYLQDVLGLLQSTLFKNDIASKRIQLEVTESLLLSDRKLVDKVLSAIQEMGVEVWLDDFGTGYSSLSYLQSFHFNGVKVDRTFVQDIESNEKNQDLVKAIISLAKKLKIKTVIEGVESEQQAQVLENFGCNIAQGYLYAKPLPKAEFEQQWLSK